jgi:ABC-type phosphate/phosphonate transport system substrate-binding protein
MKKIFALLLLIAFTLPGCEKDDICDADTNTTPRLVIEFYDYANPENLKAVVNLKVIADGQENGIVFNETGTEVTKYLANANKISIPLDTSADTITYQFILNANQPDVAQTDTLQFNYARKTLYISRACGYSVYFLLNSDSSLPNPYVLNNDPGAIDGQWIRNIDIQNYNLISENETHLKIYLQTN